MENEKEQLEKLKSELQLNKDVLKRAKIYLKDPNPNLHYIENDDDYYFLFGVLIGYCLDMKEFQLKPYKVSLIRQLNHIRQDKTLKNFFFDKIFCVVNKHILINSVFSRIMATVLIYTPTSKPLPNHYLTSGLIEGASLKKELGVELPSWEEYYQ